MAAANNGFIKLHRRMLDWGWYDDANTFRVFIHLLFTANHKDGEYRGHAIRRGQTVTGRRALAKRLDISEKGIRTALEHLQQTGEISIQATNRFSIITIEKYSDYQDNSVSNAQIIGQQTASQTANKGPAEHAVPQALQDNYKHTTANESANKRPTNGQQRATPEEGKNVRREDITTPATTTGAGEISPLPPPDTDYAEVVRMYQSEIHPVTPTTNTDIGYWFDDVGKHALLYAITEAARNNARSWPYIERILNSLKAEGCTTEAQLTERKRKRGGKTHGTDRQNPANGHYGIGEMGTPHPAAHGIDLGGFKIAGIDDRC